MLLAAATVAQAQQTHPCSANAIAKAALLLRFHNSAEPDQPVDVEQNAKMLPPIKALKGNGRFDVLEVVGHIYKASYRMRLITADQRLVLADGSGDSGSERSILIRRLCLARRM